MSADEGSRVLFEHRGSVDHTVVHRLLATAESACMADQEPVSLRKRLFNVLVEGLENVLHHGHGPFRDSTFATLLVGPQGYRMMMGNVLPHAQAQGLVERVLSLNGMDDGTLKQEYLRTMVNDARSDKGGAGLGLLTMARKSMRPILARARRIHDEASLFVVELFVPRS